MKINKAFLSIFTIMGMACYGVASADNEGKVNFKWESDIHDFGAFNEDVGRVTCQFKGVNLGPDTASVIYLNASCGCTTPKADKRIIPPGDTVTLSVTYDPANRPGIFDKKITFGTVPGYRANFHIKGSVNSSTRRMMATYPYEVGSAYRLSDNNVAFGNTREDRTVPASVRGVNNSLDTVTPTVTESPAFVSAVVEPATVKPGGTFVISLTADAPKVGQLGATFDSITVSSAEHPDMSMVIPVSILLFEEFPPMTADDVDRAAYLEIPDRNVDFGPEIDPASSKRLKRKVKVTNGGLEPLKIRRAYSITPGIEVKAPSKPIGPGKSAEIEITLIPSALQSGTTDLRARVSVISNTPLNTTMDINVSGSVKQN